MAQPKVISFGKGRLLLGDGAVPEVFVAPCGFTQGTLTFDKDTSDVTVPDCDDPDAAAWKATDVTALGWSVSFQGVLAAESLPLYEKATFTSLATSVRLELKGMGVGAGTPDKLYAGKGHVRMQINAQRGEKWQVQVDITGDGECVPSSILIA